MSPMPKKSFKNQVHGADKLFSVNDDTHAVHATSTVRDAHDAQAAHATHDARATSTVRDVHDTHATQNSRTERLSMRVDLATKEYIIEAAWRRRMSVTEYICALVKADMNANLSKDGERLKKESSEEWHEP